MIRPELLQMMVCPEDRTPLAPAGDELLAKLNAALAAGQLKNRAGQPLSQRLSAALVRQDGAVAYPVVDDIPMMLIDEAIPLDQESIHSRS